MPDPSGFPQLIVGFALVVISLTPGWLLALVSGVAHSITDFHAAVRLIPVQPQKSAAYRVTPAARLGFVLAGLWMIALGIFSNIS